MRRLTLVVIIMLLAVGCGDGGRTPVASSHGSATPRSLATPSGGASFSPDATTTVELWFYVATDTPMGQGLFPAYRDIPSTPAIGAATLRAWLDGPTAEERNAGLRSLVPGGTRLLGLDIEDGTATVDLTSEFERTGLGTTYEGLVLEQLAWTITQFPTVERALLTIDGRKKAAYMGHGFVIDEQHPLQRDDDDPVAPIVVHEPRIGARFSTGDAVSGTADVFEANVVIRVRDQNGRAVFTGFTTATCGSGCRGDFSRRLRFAIEVEQPGTIEFFEPSAEDGSKMNKVSIPVTLVP